MFLKPIIPGGGVSSQDPIWVPGVVLRRGDLLGFRETGTLAAVSETCLGLEKPKVAVVSTGDELIAPEPMQPGRVYDSNSLVGHAAEELGCLVEVLGIVGDDEKQLEQVVRRGLEADMLCSQRNVERRRRSELPGLCTIQESRNSVPEFPKPGKPPAWLCWRNPAAILLVFRRLQFSLYSLHRTDFEGNGRSSS